MALKAPEPSRATAQAPRVALKDVSNILPATPRAKNNNHDHPPPSTSGAPLKDDSPHPHVHDTDPVATRELWDAVYEHKETNEMALVPPTQSTSIPFPGISFEVRPSPSIEEHFGQTLSSRLSEYRDPAAAEELFEVLGPGKTCSVMATAAELRAALQIYLTRSASADMVQGTGALWTPARCLQGKIIQSGEADEGWHSPYFPGDRFTDVTFWLRPKQTTTGSPFWEMLPQATYATDHDHAVCPYLSVTIRDDDEAPKAAFDRLVAAGGNALYNRVCLYAKKPGAFRIPNEIKHYGLVFCWGRFGLWEFTPKPAPAGKLGTGSTLPPTKDSRDGGRSAANKKPPAPTLTGSVRFKRQNTTGASAARDVPATTMTATTTAAVTTTTANRPAVQWHGGSMRRLLRGSSTTLADLSKLTDWIREVHTWGMTSYAAAVERDVCAANGVPPPSEELPQTTPAVYQIPGGQIPGTEVWEAAREDKHDLASGGGPFP